MKDKDGLLKIDTASLEENLITQIISVFNSDSVMTEADLIERFSKEGKLYARHGGNDQLNDAIDFFGDTLQLSGALFIEARPIKGANDSIRIVSNLVLFIKEDSSTTRAISDAFCSVQNAPDRFRNELQDMLLSTQKWTIQAYVINSDDSILFFRVTKKAQLRKGTALDFFRGYKGNEGLRQYLADLKKRIDFYKNRPADSNMSRIYTTEYEKKLQSGYDGNFAQGIDIEGKVIEMYDSTGKAAWYRTSTYPEKPKAGDIIYYR